jgi:hypothetical protein
MGAKPENSDLFNTRFCHGVFLSFLYPYNTLEGGKKQDEDKKSKSEHLNNQKYDETIEF